MKILNKYISLCIYCYLLTIVPGHSVAQSASIQPITIGDTVPNVVLNNVINYSSKVANLYDFKSDLVLLDFWSTSCSACIAGFPKMNSLKNSFNKKLQIILVNTRSEFTHDNKEKIQNTLNRVKERTGVNINLPVVHNNNTLDSLFPLVFIPHIVWIRRNIVVAITGPDQVTTQNINKVLSGSVSNIHMKIDQLEYNSNKPLFINGNGGNGDQMLFRSMVTGYIEGVGSSSGFRMKDNKIIGSYLLNQSLLALMKDAYNDIMIYPDNRIIIESKNKHIDIKNNTPSKYNDLFCYETVNPPFTEKQWRKYMQEDLERYFQITVTKGNRKMKCLVLSRGENFKILAENKSIKGSLDLEKETLKKSIRNTSPIRVVQLLNNYSQIPIVDESSSSTNISIDLPFYLTDIQALKEAFKKIGFNLKEEEREMEVAVISDL